ncbi:hypothetical protein POM88_045072 [Heracleum sosnowskyi]|uniref:Uncharacterized protein n=1 Tax=Heracleum sosnowskyi TaxID=360622 RepID=A0AAD8H6E9_9APIA|nr:hypothetical protein POM88_045072 [Heracleum sosnowskyi]
MWSLDKIGEIMNLRWVINEEDWGNNDTAKYQSEDDEDYEGESDEGDDEDENQDDDLEHVEHDIRDNSDSDLSNCTNCRRIRDESSLAKVVDNEMCQEIREALKKYRGRESDDDDDTNDGSYSSDDDDTDGIAYVEPKAKKKKVKGLDKAVREFLPLVEHRFCARHLSSNLTKILCFLKSWRADLGSTGWYTELSSETTTGRRLVNDWSSTSQRLVDTKVLGRRKSRSSTGCRLVDAKVHPRVSKPDLGP